MLDHQRLGVDHRLQQCDRLSRSAALQRDSGLGHAQPGLILRGQFIRQHRFETVEVSCCFRIEIAADQIIQRPQRSADRPMPCVRKVA